MEDKKLVDAALEGDYSAFEKLVDKYADRIYLTGIKMCGDPDVAEEMVQETFLKAYKSLPQYRGEASFFTWMFTIARNICMAHFRREGSRPDSLSLDSSHSGEGDAAGMDVPDDTENPEAALLRREFRERLNNALFMLPNDQRLAFILRDLHGLSYNEVAEALGKTLGAAKTDIRRARIKLREQLAPYIVS